MGTPILGRMLGAVDAFSRRLVTAANEVSARLDRAWRSMILVLRDTWFKLTLIGRALGTIAKVLSPGLVLLAVGIAFSLIWVWILGGGYVAVMVSVAWFGPSPESDDPEVEWVRFFPPSWLDNHQVKESLSALVRGWAEADRAVSSLLDRTKAQNPLRRPLQDVRNGMHARMHGMRRPINLALASSGRGVILPTAVGQAHDEFTRIRVMATELIPQCLDDSPHGPASVTEDDTLKQALDSLDDIISALRSLQ